MKQLIFNFILHIQNFPVYNVRYRNTREEETCLGLADVTYCSCTKTLRNVKYYSDPKRLTCGQYQEKQVTLIIK